MAYAARLDDSNIVKQVIKLDDVDCADDATATAFCNKIYGTSGVVWKKTSYNSVAGVYYITDPETGARTVGPDQSKLYRWTFAGVNMSYNESKDAFIGPQPYASWTLGDDNIWHSPNEPTEWINPDTGNTFPEGEPFRVWSEADQEWTVQDYDTNPATDSDADFEALTAGGLSTYKWNGSVWVKQ
jgi:hypothetical protein